MKNADVGKLLPSVLHQVSTLLRETANIEQNANIQSQKEKQKLEKLIKYASNDIRKYEERLAEARDDGDSENETKNLKKLEKEQKHRKELE